MYDTFYSDNESKVVVMEEICDNGVDDDGDGLIDLNDSDCDCVPPVYPSLVPNHSFEDTLCCPTGFSQLECAVAWQQASYSTTDYFHTCSSFYEEKEYPPPLPLPDGDGFSGFVNSVRTNEDGSLKEYKEYAGACLNGPMEEGVVYRIEFMIGFVSKEKSRSVRLGLYGTPSCEDLPFDRGENKEECPGKHKEWVELGQVECVYERPGWRRFYIDFIPEREINAIALGPNCDVLNVAFHAYYYLDDIQLSQPESILLDNDNYADRCNVDTLFSMETKEFHTFQWYKEGVALVGETKSWINRGYGEGVYQVKVLYGGLCEVFDFEYEIPIDESYYTDTMCFNTSYRFHSHVFETVGTYEVLLENDNGCDSLVYLKLLSQDVDPDTVNALLPPNGNLMYNGNVYKDIGLYDVISDNGEYCPLLSMLKVEPLNITFPNIFSPNGDGMNDVFTAKGDHADLIETIGIYDRWGNKVSSDLPWDGRQKNQMCLAGVYLYTATVVLDGESYNIAGNITLIF